MRDYLANEVRNIVLLGHAGSGKSSLVESILYFNKVTDRMDRTSAMDFDSEEQKRGQSVYTALAPIEWKNCKINFIDTPGYFDFYGETAAGVKVADNALIVVSAKDGIETGTEKAYETAMENNLPTIFFVNKMDDEHADFHAVYDSLRKEFGEKVIAFEIPIFEGEKAVGSVNILRKKAWFYNDRTNAKDVPENLVGTVDAYYEQICEALAMTDDELMESYFEDGEFNQDEIIKGLNLAVRSGEVVPVYCGSSLQQTGIERLLDLITEFFPSYAEKGTVTAYNGKGETVELKTDESETMSAFVFKTIVDPFVGRISYLKVMTGVLSTDAQVVNVNKEANEKIAQIYSIRGKHQIAVGKLFTGDIGAVVKLSATQTNDTLAVKERPVYYAPIEFPAAMLSLAIWPKSKNDEDKLSSSLQRILEEDQSARLENNSETNELVLYGLGDQHIDVILKKLKEKYKVEVTTTQPTVPYRETIQSKVTAEGKHKKQSGGAGQYGHVFVDFEPVDSEDMVFEETVFGGSVPRQYFPAVEQGLRECMLKGVLAGYKVVGVKATLTDGSYHDVDSKEIAFKSAARLAYNQGMPKAKPVILEPIVKADVIVPEDFVGTVIGDFNKRRGMILGMDMLPNDKQRVSAEVPLSEMMNYATQLRSFTQGKGNYTQEFVRYQRAPQEIMDKVILDAQRRKEAEQ
ncbi:MAG TPA: elongation factor G [Erysipelothrix sp.]|jgi:elongation factor G|nr:elongation factor G [Erysipelothrix sp.]